MYTLLTLFIALPLLLLLAAALFHKAIFQWLDGYFYRRLNVEEYNEDNPYATGSFRPIHTEMDCVEAEVIGAIPVPARARTAIADFSEVAKC